MGDELGKGKGSRQMCYFSDFSVSSPCSNSEVEVDWNTTCCYDVLDEIM